MTLVLSFGLGQAEQYCLQYMTEHLLLGEDPRVFFQQEREQIKDGMKQARRDFLDICEDHLLKFENNC